MGIYIFIVFCIILGAAVLTLLQVFLSTRRGRLAGLWLPLFSLLLWLVLQLKVVALDSVVTLSESGQRLVLIVLLLCFVFLTLIYVLSRRLRQRNIDLRDELRTRKIRFKDELHRRELAEREKQG